MLSVPSVLTLQDVQSEEEEKERHSEKEVCGCGYLIWPWLHIKTVTPRTGRGVRQPYH